ncbi:MAG TPA: FtsQ-type POTRA domain-containing protein [Candidatus Acidoferrales bacterium]|nr:FtsQ-type POTRA domain-containing protein [Candidatus Acidoferrales bacterium]
MWAAVGLAGAGVAFETARFLLASPEMALIHPEQVSLKGNHYVPPESVREIFVADRGRSVLRIPLERRRSELEEIPWVEQATVRRALPNRIEVEITERTPIAFLRESSDMALVDVHGVILERPVEGDFRFPVVTGMDADMALEDRERRMQLFSGFMEQIESARPGAAEQVSEVDLSDEHDLRATISGLQGGAATGSDADAPVLVHFGDNDFAGKYQTLVEDIGQWRAKAGRVESVDLRFSREAVVNQDTTAVAQKRAPKQAAHAAKKPR